MKIILRYILVDYSCIWGTMLINLDLLVQGMKTYPRISLFLNNFFVVGGGLPVVHKQPLAQKKPPWQQDKIAHNPLDSTSPLVKKGKQREVPKAKKPTPLKKASLEQTQMRYIL